MNEFLTQLPQSPIAWVGLIFATVGAGFAAYLVYTKQRDGVDDRLITLLKETVDALDEKVNKQSKDIEELTTKVNDLEKENGTLIEILQGRDKNTLEFQKQMLETMRVVMETNCLAKHTSEKIGVLVDLMERHLNAVEMNQKREEAE